MAESGYTQGLSHGIIMPELEPVGEPRVTVPWAGGNPLSACSLSPLVSPYPPPTLLIKPSRVYSGHAKSFASYASRILGGLKGQMLLSSTTTPPTHTQQAFSQTAGPPPTVVLRQLEKVGMTEPLSPGHLSATCPICFPDVQVTQLLPAAFSAHHVALTLSASPGRRAQSCQ